MAGAALGALIGLLIGLATSGVAGSVVAGLVALLAAFFGLQGGSARLPSTTPQRIASFSVAAAITVLAGVAIRATDALSPALESRSREWQAAGFDAKTAGHIVAFERLGVVPGAWTAPEGAIEAASRRTTLKSSVLFAGAAAKSCDALAHRKYPGAHALTRAMNHEEGVWAAFAKAVPSNLPEASRTVVLRAAIALVCEDG